MLFEKKQFDNFGSKNCRVAGTRRLLNCRFVEYRNSTMR